jgi:hypothetical protein
MAQNSGLYENAATERVNEVLKQDFYSDKYNKDLPIVKQIVEQKIDICNKN